DAEIDELLAEVRRIARAHGWRLAVVGASGEQLARYRAFGLKPVAMGEEAVLRPQEFSLEGRAIRKVRQSVSRLRKSGYSFRIVAADEVAPALEAELEELSAAWLCGQPERGFSMSIDDLHVPGTVLALAEDAEGRLGGFLHLAPSPRAGNIGGLGAGSVGGGWSLSTMRRRPDSPNGLTEFLVVEALAWARETDASELSLNFCAMTDFLAPDRVRTPVRRLASGRRAAWPFSREHDPQHRSPVRDRAGHGAPRLRLLLRGAQAERSPAGPLGGGSARGRGGRARRRLRAGPAPARGARRARADVRQVRPAPLDATRRRAPGHRGRAAWAAGRRAAVPVRAGRAGDRGGAREHARAAVPRFRAGAGRGRLDRSGAPGDPAEWAPRRGQ